jgi:hypothetical protein
MLAALVASENALNVSLMPGPYGISFDQASPHSDIVEGHLKPSGHWRCAVPRLPIVAGPLRGLLHSSITFRHPPKHAFGFIVEFVELQIEARERSFSLIQAFLKVLAASGELRCGTLP